MTEFITIHKTPYVSKQREISNLYPVIARHRWDRDRTEMFTEKKRFDRFFENRNPLEWEIC